MRVPILGTIDERFLQHRLRSTSIGGIAGILVAAGAFMYQLYGHHILRWDLFAVVATMAAVKISVLTWYRLHD